MYLHFTWNELGEVESGGGSTMGTDKNWTHHRKKAVQPLAIFLFYVQLFCKIYPHCTITMYIKWGGISWEGGGEGTHWAQTETGRRESTTPFTIILSKIYPQFGHEMRWEGLWGGGALWAQTGTRHTIGRNQYNPMCYSYNSMLQNILNWTWNDVGGGWEVYGWNIDFKCE